MNGSKLKVFVGIPAVLFLSVFLHASVSVQVQGNPTVSQDLLLASSEYGDWKSEEFYAAVEPGHSYKLKVRAKVGDLSARVSFQPFFDTTDGQRILLVPLQARAHFEVVHSSEGLLVPGGVFRLGYYLHGTGLSNCWWRDLKIQDQGVLTDGACDKIQAKGLGLAFERFNVGTKQDIEFDLPKAAEVNQHGFPMGCLRGELVYRLGNGAGFMKPTSDKEAITFTWEGCNASEGAASVGLFLKARDGDAWILPLNGGIRLPVAQCGRLRTGGDLPVRAGHYLSMPFIGLQRGDGILMMINATPEDSMLRYSPSEQEVGFKWLSSHGAWGSPRRLRLSWIPSGGVAAMAQAYRFWVESQRPVKTLADKAQSVPRVLALAGAVNIHYWKKAAWWTNDQNSAAVAQAFKQAGLKQVLWSQKASDEGVQQVKAAGFTAGRYENFQDLYTNRGIPWQDSEGWPVQAEQNERGEYLKGWWYKQGNEGYYAGIRNPQLGLSHLQDVFHDETRPYQAVFIDTTTASAPTEDWTLAHPLTRAEDLEAKRLQLAEASQVRRWVTGSESGHDGALNEVHYFEGMKSPWPGRFDDSGYDLVTRKPATQAMLDFNLGPQFRIPLFELVYHDCVVDYEYWGDSANRLPDYWRFRDLLSCLYGQPELWVLDAELWKEQQARCVKSYQTWGPVVTHLFGQKMIHWTVVNADPNIQETQWQDGSIVRVDFAKDRLTLSGPVASAGVQP